MANNQEQISLCILKRLKNQKLKKLNSLRILFRLRPLKQITFVLAALIRFSSSSPITMEFRVSYKIDPVFHNLSGSQRQSRTNRLRQRERSGSKALLMRNHHKISPNYRKQSQMMCMSGCRYIRQDCHQTVLMQNRRVVLRWGAEQEKCHNKLRKSVSSIKRKRK